MDRIVSNPPTHAGSQVLVEMFEGMLRVLVPGGTALLVVRERLNYERWLAKLGETTSVATGGGYKILELRKR